MKKTAMTLLATPILITLLMLGMTSQAIAGGNRDVLIMTCSSDPIMPMGPLVVFSVTRSEGANDVDISVHNPMPFPGPPPGPPLPGEGSMGANCAQALADLLNAGFKINNSQGDFSVIYTLTRKGRKDH